MSLAMSRLPTRLRTLSQETVEMLIKTGISSTCIGKDYGALTCDPDGRNDTNRHVILHHNSLIKHLSTIQQH
jgi:hypothetical protein